MQGSLLFLKVHLGLLVTFNKEGAPMPSLILLSLIFLCSDGEKVLAGSLETTWWRAGWFATSGVIGDSANDRIYLGQVLSHPDGVLILDSTGAEKGRLDYRPFFTGMGFIPAPGQKSLIMFSSLKDSEMAALVLQSGSLLWQNKVAHATDDFQAHDLDGDGTQELVHVDDETGLYVYDSKGNLLWEKTYVGGSGFDSVAVGDLDNDRIPEIFAIQDGAICVYSPKGTLIKVLEVGTSGNRIRIVRLGTQLLLLVGNSDSLFSVDYAGQLLWTLSLPVPGGFLPLAVADSKPWVAFYASDDPGTVFVVDYASQKILAQKSGFNYPSLGWITPPNASSPQLLIADDRFAMGVRIVE